MQHDVKELPWAASSPDWNPIENLWTLLKINVSMRKPSNYNQLVKAIHKKWNLLPKELAENLMLGTNNRIQCAIESNGDYTMY